MDTSTSACIRERDGSVPKDVTNNPHKHRTRYVNKLKDPLPEVLIFNLTYEKSPKPSDIFKILLTLPETLTPQELYSGQQKSKEKYVMKGMICFQAAHYLAFFRRVLIKYDYLDIQYNTASRDLQEMDREITPSTEWVCYNDTFISSLKEGWFTLIEQCV
jgi:hypothetical protein